MEEWSEGGRWFLLSLIELVIKILALLVLVNSFTMVGILFSLLMDSGFAIFFMPSVDSKISASLEKFHRGAVWGVQQSIMTLASMGLMYVGGMLWDAIGPANTVYIHTSYVVVLIGILYILAKLDNQSVPN